MKGLQLLDSSGQVRLQDIRTHVERRTHRSRRLRQLLARPRLGLGPQFNRVALLIRLHHAAADGLAAQSLLTALFDPDGQTSVAEAVSMEIQPRPSDWELFTGNARDHGRALARVLTTLAHPAHLAAFLATGAQQMSLARAGRAPAVSLNEPVGPRRRLILVRNDLASTKALAHRYGARLTDLLLAAYAGGCRAYWKPEAS
ncbi:wax ester/triacylglycerol synthase family O-acyltransferase [Arthrobacter sp. ISL-5]|uniref:wax ester/triacylglycerol synthase family O-acyltransferase n=1 Tax=Arthrobacter sp. ISL-5 TaxID=2819111 RepID=UPI001BEB25F9|nr:wax ester/triacylglycerol synthase family O-acyltransferase [Arthrobacter sp. ISL-5]MBT2554646.1 hypothetical protein [Arthrobacter sp. ISL-5]